MSNEMCLQSQCYASFPLAILRKKRRKTLILKFEELYANPRKNANKVDRKGIQLLIPPLRISRLSMSTRRWVLI